MQKWKTRCLILLMAALLMVPGMAYAAETTSFSDVSGTYWAKDEIDSLVQLGIVKGYQDHTFKPAAPVTREEFAQLLTLAFYLDLPTEKVQTFQDVATTRWSYLPIEAAKDFLTGYYTPNGKAFFDPTAKATREDVAVALVKALNYQIDDLENPNILDRFYDSDDVSPNLSGYMAIAIEKKLMTGYSNGTLKPNDPVTRAEAAALIYRVIKSAASDGQTSLELNVTAPETTSSSTFYVTGDVTKGASVTINNSQVEVEQGQFRWAVQLEAEGTYTYTVTARLAGGKTQTVTKQVVFAKGAPTLDVRGVPEQTDKQSITLSWTVKDDNDSNPVVYVNGERQSSYTTSTTVNLEDGDNTIVVRAENSSGQYTEVTKHVVFNGGGPTLTVSDLAETTDKDTVTVSWTVKDKNDSSPTVYVNDQQQSSYSTSATVKLKEGSNTIVFKATNKLGKSTQVTKTITFQVGASNLTVGSLPQSTDKNSIIVTWTVSDTNDLSPTVYVNDEQQSSYTSSKTVALEPGTNTITVRSVNKLGKTTEVTRTVEFDPPSPTLTLVRAPSVATTNTVTISWTVSDKNDSNITVYVNDEPQSTYTTSKTLSLVEGTNSFIISASNKYGKMIEIPYSVTYTPNP